MESKRHQAALELLKRRKSRSSLANYVLYTLPGYKTSFFSSVVCEAIEKFILDFHEKKRPVLVLQAPPQHGKSEIVSRRLPAYLLSKYPDLRIGAASYSDELAGSIAQSVRWILASVEHQSLFPANKEKMKYRTDTIREFSSPYGSGNYIGVGVGSGLTGRSIDIGIIDDPIKDAQQSLSSAIKTKIFDWYQSVFSTRLQQKSGQIIMATSWAEDDLSARIIEIVPHAKVLRFPAINEKTEPGYNPNFPIGALCPGLHSLEKLQEQKSRLSAYWWSALYQQRPTPLGGQIFKEPIHYYDVIPDRFEQIISSWDATFKDRSKSDFVCGQVWGKVGDKAYLLDQTHARMSFTNTLTAIIDSTEKWKPYSILIEDAANGPAIIDTLTPHLKGKLKAIKPDGSKEARAHAVTYLWEQGRVLIPAKSRFTQDFVKEIISFPGAAHDDQVDAMTQALRHLFPKYSPISIHPKLLARTRMESNVYR